ncbi:unnamed protein product [Effrenium voratum]|nr:unnamed protein product [Effrenium voratum]
MTLRHLLMHTSGFGYGPGAITPGVPLVARSDQEKLYKDITVKQESGEIDTLEKLCVELSRLPLLHQPGSDYTYGMSFDVLGHVMELVLGEPLHQIIRSRVLAPVGMRDACFLVPQSKIPTLAGYFRLMRDEASGERWLERLDGAHGRDSMYVKGSKAAYGSKGVPAAGGLWGAGRSTMLFSLRDVLLFCQMLLNGGRAVSGHRVLKESTVQSLLTNWLRLKRACKQPSPPGWGSEDAPGMKVKHFPTRTTPERRFYAETSHLLARLSGKEGPIFVWVCAEGLFVRWRCGAQLPGWPNILRQDNNRCASAVRHRVQACD